MPNGPANDHLTRGGISLSSAPAAVVPSTATAPARASAQILLVPLIALSPAGPDASSFRCRRAARHRRAGRLAPDRFADRARQRPRSLAQPEQRQDDEEVNDIPSGEDARGPQ